jgi:hypothetical protein
LKETASGAKLATDDLEKTSPATPMEDTVVLVSIHPGQTMVLAAANSYWSENKIAITQLAFDKMMRAASYLIWLTNN